MATAKVQEAKPVNPPKEVVLILSEKEANNLAAVLSCVSTGSDYDTYPIYLALANAGIEVSSSLVGVKTMLYTVEFNKK